MVQWLDHPKENIHRFGLDHGPPSESTYSRLFARIAPRRFAGIVGRTVKARTKEKAQLAIDGKTSRAAHVGEDGKAVHILDFVATASHDCLYATYALSSLSSGAQTPFSIQIGYWSIETSFSIKDAAMKEDRHAVQSDRTALVPSMLRSQAVAWFKGWRGAQGFAKTLRALALDPKPIWDARQKLTR